MDSRFRQSDFGAAKGLRKGLCAESARAIRDFLALRALNLGCAFMTNPTLASRRVRGSSPAGEETALAKLSWLLGPLLYEQL
jgi:hypothetical protein